MQGKHWLIVCSFVAVAASGCRTLNSEYCREHPEDLDCANAPGDKCGDVQCRAPTPVCKMETTCVECVESTDCPISRPTCSADNTCIECEQDSTCMSELCLPDRTCADPGDVAHVDGTAGVDNPECSPAMPCKTLQHVMTLVPFRRFIKATGMISGTGTINIDRKTVSIFGEPGMTTITRDGGGAAPVFDIRHDSVVTLVDLEIIAGGDGNAVEIREAPGPRVSMTRVKVRDAKDNGIQVEAAGRLEMTDSQVSNCTLVGINVITGGSLVMTGSQVFKNTLDGVKVTAGGQIEIRRSSITENKGTAGVASADATMVVIDSSIIAVNTGTSGGLSIKGPLTIRNSIISANGNIATSSIGGFSLDSASATFEFNTVADNSGSTAAVKCATLIDLSNSIFAGSSFDGTGCNVTYSLTRLTDLPVPTGMNNKIGDPMFMSTSLSSPMFYRIGPASAAKDSADPGATLGVDIDGQMRTGRRDMGADEAN